MSIIFKKTGHMTSGQEELFPPSALLMEDSLGLDPVYLI